MQHLNHHNTAVRQNEIFEKNTFFPEPLLRGPPLQADPRIILANTKTKVRKEKETRFDITITQPLTYTHPHWRAIIKFIFSAHRNTTIRILNIMRSDIHSSMKCT